MRNTSVVFRVNRAMKYTSTFLSAAFLLVGSSTAASAEPWKTLTPNAAIPADATTNFPGQFGISIHILPTGAPGQVEHATSAAPLEQISDGQIQHQTTASPPPPPAAQISDGQVQHQTTASPPLPPAAQISDGQVQHQTTAPPPPPPAAQISDGQVQHQTTIPAAAQISDGQVQHHTTLAGATALGSELLPKSGKNDNSLTMSLHDSILTDSQGRIGAIVANRQFQFDGPPPQEGTIYAAGWSIYNGLLALGNQTDFYRSQSGDFYNLYDQPVSPQSELVQFQVLDFSS